MVIFAVVLMVIGVMSLMVLATLEGRDAYRSHRADQARIERQKRIAERRLHDISSRAFESMLDEARHSSGVSDHPGWQ